MYILGQLMSDLSSELLDELVGEPVDELFGEVVGLSVEWWSVGRSVGRRQVSCM